MTSLEKFVKTWGPYGFAHDAETGHIVVRQRKRKFMAYVKQALSPKSLQAITTSDQAVLDRLAELEAALRPFANYASGGHDNFTVSTTVIDGKHFLAARTALQDSSG